MKKSISLLIALLLGMGLFSCTLSSSNTGWLQGGSGDEIAVNEEHIFNGQYKYNGKVVGFHSRPGGEDPDNAWVNSVIDKPNDMGIYTASVTICKTSAHKKCGTKNSSFFPDSMSAEQVIAAIQYAYENQTTDGNPFRGPSGEDFSIEGYTLTVDDVTIINTAYPLYTN